MVDPESSSLPEPRSALPARSQALQPLVFAGGERSGRPHRTCPVLVQLARTHASPLCTPWLLPIDDVRRRPWRSWRKDGHAEPAARQPDPHGRVDQRCNPPQLPKDTSLVSTATQEPRSGHSATAGALARAPLQPEGVPVIPWRTSSRNSLLREAPSWPQGRGTHPQGPRPAGLRSTTRRTTRQQPRCNPPHGLAPSGGTSLLLTAGPGHGQERFGTSSSRTTGSPWRTLQVPRRRASAVRARPAPREGPTDLTCGTQRGWSKGRAQRGGGENTQRSAPGRSNQSGFPTQWLCSPYPRPGGAPTGGITPPCQRHMGQPSHQERSMPRTRVAHPRHTPRRPLPAATPRGWQLTGRRQWAPA